MLTTGLVRRGMGHERHPMLRPHDRRHDLGSAHAPATTGSLRPPRLAARPGDAASLLLRGLPCAERQHGLPQRPRSGLLAEIA